MIKTMDYGDKQYFIALRGIVEEKEAGWEDCAKELRESLEAAQKEAETGNPIGQFNLAMHYYYGFGVEESDEQAFKWYEKAAIQGHSDAMHNLAWNYGQARGVDKDMAKFYEWEKKAAFAYYAESKTADPETAEDKIGSAVHAVLCYADGPPDAEVIALFSQMRNDPRVQEYAAKRYSATPTFLDDLERRLKEQKK
jgi:TPR repeat protein